MGLRVLNWLAFVVDFKNTIIILTSNIGSEIYNEKLRPKRVINELVFDEITPQVIEVKIKPSDKVVADYKAGKVTISVEKPN